MKIYLHYLLRILGLSVAAWLILKPEWSVTGPDGLELHLARWIWQGPAPRAGWTINGINWPSTLFFAGLPVMLTWSFFGPIDRRVGAPITESRRTTLLIELHRAIAETATRTARALASGSAGDDMAYPPNERLSREEAASLKQLSVDAITERALAKTIADSTASAVFSFFALMDAVADPGAPFDGDVWLGAQLAEPDKSDHPMLHDAFFDTYRDYRGAS